MKKNIFIMLIVFTVISCKDNYEDENEIIESVENITVSASDTLPSIKVDVMSESNQKLIDICERMEGIVDADIKDDILTIRGNVSETEAQELGDGMLGEIKKYNKNIKTVIVCDLNYKILGYSGK
jgi:hypothetical protein